MSELQLSGSCLCGSVAFEINGTAMHFQHCHCERCRKASGTGHASNIIMKSASVRWTAGESLVSRYKVPEARRFSTAFCSNCGSAVPRVNAETQVVVVPAGCLDDEPGIWPERRIFQDSRAAWSCVGDDLPVFDTYPDAR